jgi:hypothetical protein
MLVRRMLDKLRQEVVKQILISQESLRLRDISYVLRRSKRIKKYDVIDSLR